MIEDKSNGFDTTRLFYFLIWSPRISSKMFYHFLKVNVKKNILNNNK